MEMIKNILAQVGSPVSRIINNTEHHILGGIIIVLVLCAALWVFI